MVRLSDRLAARRIVYARPIATLPDILAIDVPEPFAHPSLSLGRYYGVMIETACEAASFEAFLTAERAALVRPDLLDHRPTGLDARCITIARYAPPAAGWPWILLCHWPADHVAAVPTAQTMFARRAYTIEMVETEQALAELSATLIAILSRRNKVEVTLVNCDGTTPAGSA